jgi:hypothetical protein
MSIMETIAPSSPIQGAPVDATCPRCKKPLADPGGLGWCQACGYCRSLEEDRARLPLDKPAAKSSAEVAPAGMMPQKSSVWAIVLFAGVVVLGVGCFAASRYFALTPLQRALWTSIQILAGVAIMITGQCYALLIIAPKDGTLHITDAIVPFRLYSLMFKHLGRACVGIWCGGWGLTIVLSALICVGGLGHWLNYLPKSKESQQFRWN